MPKPSKTPLSKLMQSTHYSTSPAHGDKNCYASSFTSNPSAPYSASSAQGDKYCYIPSLSNRPAETQSPISSQDALQVLRFLASGRDPSTNVQFSEDSPYRSERVVCSLRYAIDAVSGAQSVITSRRPPAAGEFWNSFEESNLNKEFKSGLSIPEIAQAHGRSLGAIRSRLDKLGLIKHTPNCFAQNSSFQHGMTKRPRF